VKARSSFRSQLAIGSLLWTIGLLVLISMLAIHLLANNPRPHKFVYRLFFDSPVVIVLIVGAAAMVGGAWQIRRSLTAMSQLHGRLTAVHRGEHREVTGHYPSEVQPLVDDLNALLAERDQRVQRALAKAGDLAHGLKTPLAVLARDAERVSASGDHELAASMAAQVERMRRQIDYHLAHARAAAAGTGPGTRSLVASSVDGLIRTLERLHAERAIALRSTVAPGHAVRCPREDLDEMLGNLLDNACKWGRSQVEMASDAAGSSIVITVDDDGPGIDPAMAAQVLERGVRADEQMEGTGLGLAIVRDLAEIYGGAIDLSRSPLGGVRARLQLPTSDT
jgi:signal transduction histidine kinase